MRRTKNKNKKSFLAGFLALVMILSVIPVSVLSTFAEGTTSEITTDINEKTFIVGTSTDFTYTTVANDDAGKYVKGSFVIKNKDNGDIVNIADVAKLEYKEYPSGIWYEFYGDFGPEAGFPLTNATSNFRATFTKAGNYTVEVTMKLVEGSSAVCSVTTDVVVKGVPSVLTTNINEKTFYAGAPTEFDFGIIANDDAGKYIFGSFEIKDTDTDNTLNIADVAKLEYKEYPSGIWYEFYGDFGPAGTGFPMTDATSHFRVTFKTSGSFTVIVKAKSATDDTIYSQVSNNIVVESGLEISAPTVVGGSIKLNSSESENITIDYGTDAEIEITADEGYQIKSVSVNEVLQTITDNATFAFSLNSVTEDIKIDVVFVKVYTIKVDYDSTDGVVTTTPTLSGGEVTVETDTDVTIEADPNDNWRVESVLINGIPASGDAGDEKIGKNFSSTDIYQKVLNADKDYIVEITFAKNTYDITADKTENGTITLGSASVEHGGSVEVTIIPNEGYAIGSISVNNVEISTFDEEMEDGSVKFTVADVLKSQKVVATFVVKQSISTEISNMFNSSDAIRVDGMTYIFANNASVTFTTDKIGIRMYNSAGKKISGGTNTKSITIKTTTKIGKIQLYYKAPGQKRNNWNNVSGISNTVPLVIEFDKTTTTTTLTPDELHKGEFYNSNFSVGVSVEDTGNYSGIASVEYFVTDTPIANAVYFDNVASKLKTQEGSLYTYENKIDNKFKGTIDITVSELINNSDYVNVWLKVTDRAGNIEYTRENYKVNCTAPKLVSVSVDGVLHTEATAGFYDSTRTATITISDRASTFDETEATKGIEIISENVNGEKITINKFNMVSWASDGDIHVATITFTESANYKWSISYKNKAGKLMDKSSVTETGDSLYVFTVDKKAPTGEISYNIGGTWDLLLNTLTFGIWAKVDITATASKDDEICGTYDVLYYKSNETYALSETELDAIFEAGQFQSNIYTVSADENFVIYARITDYAGNTLYISTDGAVVDKTESRITIVPDAANSNGFYNKDVNVNITVTDMIEADTAFSGIKTIDYQVIDLNKNGEVTQEGNLYSFGIANHKYSDLVPSWNDSITVDKDLNNSSNIKVIVTVVDNAGNTHSESILLAINIDKVTATIDVDGIIKANARDGYFSVENRTATINIIDRPDSFDATAATAGIHVDAVDAKGKTVENAYTVSEWTSVGNVHTATVIFSEDANYTWSFSYKNKADNILDAENDLSTGTSIAPFYFTVDDTDPTGTVTVNTNTWDRLLNVLTFGLYSNVKADVTATKDDATSPAIIEYIKTENPIIMSEADLDAVEIWTEVADKQTLDDIYSVESITNDEQFTFYLRITDYAGNYTYISSDGYIVDKIAGIITSESSPANGKINPSDEQPSIYFKESDVYVDVTVTDNAPYSGIKSITYWIECDGVQKQKQEYIYAIDNPAQAQLVSEQTIRIDVDKVLNNNCNVVVYVEVVDNAGNTSLAYEKLDIDITSPTIDVSFDNDRDNNGNTYFDANRTATVVIFEREHHFDAEKATEGIKITAVDVLGNAVEDAYTISEWTKTDGTDNIDDTKWTATVEFKKDANYTWSISYTDKAGNENAPVNTGNSVAPWDFTIDTIAPTGSVIAVSTEGRNETWDDLQKDLTFNFWSKQEIAITGTANDVTSGPIAKIEYYKVKATDASDGTTALSTTELDSTTGWITVTEMHALNEVYDIDNIISDEQFAIYLRITDLAGNYSYVSTNGLIVDHNAPVEETIAPEITVEPEQPINGIYNGDVKAAIKVVDKTIGGTYAGIKTIKYKVLNMGVETQNDTLYMFDIADPKQKDLLQTWAGEITVDSLLNNSNDVEIIVWAEDNALNADESSTSIKIDITKPTIDVSYDNNAVDSDTFFKDNRTATIVITERNFNSENVVFAITKDGEVFPVNCIWNKTEGIGNLDDTKWSATVEFTDDGDYEFSVEYTDLANWKCESAEVNYGTGVAPTVFTIDHTAPTVAVTYDNNDAIENYYKADRTATIVIDEHNFDPSRVSVMLSATDDGQNSSTPTVSAWTTNGDKHTATIHYANDSLYTFDIAIKDKSGNDSTDFATQKFYIDKTAPSLAITGVADKSANNGDVIPVITYSDTNYDADKVEITLVGVNRKNVELDGNYTDIHNGRTFTFNNFAEEKGIDDIYTLIATLTDKAGNTSTETIVFSVNRFGSTYTLSESAKRLNGTYVKEPVDVVLTEINANELSNIVVNLFKNNETIVLKEGDNYKIDVEGGNGQWYRYTYTIFTNNFTDDAVYTITVESNDEAGNDAKNDSDTKNTSISFGIDDTLPIINIENLDSKTTYAVDSMTVQMSIKDNLKLAKVIVELDGQEIKVWADEELNEIVKNGGNFSFDISGDSTDAHNLVVYAIDDAGNGKKVNGELPVNAEKVENFYVTTNLWVRYYTNKPLFFGSIAGIILVAGLIVFLVVYKKKKDANK